MMIGKWSLDLAVERSLVTFKEAIWVEYGDKSLTGVGTRKKKKRAMGDSMNKSSELSPLVSCEQGQRWEMDQELEEEMRTKGFSFFPVSFYLKKTTNYKR